MSDPVEHLCRRLDEITRRREALGFRTDPEAQSEREALAYLEGQIRDEIRAMPREYGPGDKEQD